MTYDLRQKVIAILEQILLVEDEEIRECAIESLIELLKDEKDDE